MNLYCPAQVSQTHPYIREELWRFVRPTFQINTQKTWTCLKVWISVCKSNDRLWTFKRTVGGLSKLDKSFFVENAEMGCFLGFFFFFIWISDQQRAALSSQASQIYSNQTTPQRTKPSKSKMALFCFPAARRINPKIYSKPAGLWITFLWIKDIRKAWDMRKRKEKGF